MMNIRYYFLINKTKSTNKIKILELLGFESDTLIEDTSNNDALTEKVDIVNDEKFETLSSNTEEINIYTSSIDTYIADNTATSKVVDQTPTDTFNPLNITEQIQRVWSDLESRRRWVMPTIILLSLTFVVSLAANTYMNYTDNQEAVVEQAVVVTNNSNELVELLPDLINISTNTFYSKYDVSNASASLQQIESSLIQYRDNLQNRSDIANIASIDEDLTNIFKLVNELDLVLSYRILISEVLIYPELPISEETVDIEALTADLSNVIAQSKVNYAGLPDVEEFNKHKLLVNDAITTAENLHGRYLGALRNNEYDVAQSIASAIILNKETESNVFENALNQFKTKSMINFEKFNNLP